MLLRLRYDRERFGRAPIRRDPARFANDKALDPRATAFDVFVVDAVVADQRIGHADDLAGVARVGQDLLIAGHRGVKDHLAERLAIGAKRRTHKSASVFKNQGSLYRSLTIF